MTPGRQTQRAGYILVSLWFANIALAMGTGALDFFPSRTAFWLALAYALACLCIQSWALVYLRRNRDTPITFGKGAYDGLIYLPRFPVAFVVIISGFAFVAMARGASGLGTWVLGHESEVTYTVLRVHRNRKSTPDCYSYRFIEQDDFTSLFNGVCLPQQFQAGSRFKFTGQSSVLGMHHDSVVVEKPAVRAR